jgi:hypothetical protein
MYCSRVRRGFRTSLFFNFLTILSLVGNISWDTWLVNHICHKLLTRKHRTLSRSVLISLKDSIEILHVEAMLILEGYPINSIYWEIQFVARTTHPKLANHPTGLVLEHPLCRIKQIDHEGVVVKRRHQHLSSVFSLPNCHEPGVVLPAQNAQDAIGKTIMRTWSHDLPPPTKMISHKLLVSIVSLNKMNEKFVISYRSPSGLITSRFASGMGRSGSRAGPRK